jgi:hypothetical protein
VSIKSSLKMLFELTHPEIMGRCSFHHVSMASDG